MATTIKDLLTQAAVIRDAASQGENTAMRVGTLFVDLVQRIVDTLSAEALSALGLRTTATEDKITITYKTVDAGGTAKDASVTLPSATTATAGVMSSAQLAAINNATQDISSIIQRLTTSETSIKTATDSTKAVADALAAHAAANDKAFADEASARKAVSDALAAHETADAADHAAIRKTLSDSLASAKQEQHDTLGISGIVAFDGFVGDVTDDSSTAAPIVRDPKGKVQQGAATVHFSTADGNFLIKQEGNYYPKWDDDYLWQDSNQVPWSDKAYYNVNDGKLYKFGSDNQLHEIALTKLRDDIGILPCKVRMAAPLGTPTTGYPTAHNYTIWWSQTAKAFFAAVGYDQAVAGDAIEGCEYYPLSVCDEYTDYCTLSGSGSTQTATPRTDRIYRSGNDLWQYDKAAGKMVKLGDVTGKDLAIRNLECDDATLQGDVEVAGYLEVGNSLTVQNGLTVDKGNIICPTGDIQGYGVRGNLAKFGEADEVQIDIDGNISTIGKVSGIVVHGDSATFCQADEVKIDINGNISTEGNLTVKGVANIENGAAVAGELTCAALTASSAEVNGGILANRVEADGDIIAGGSIKTSTIVPGSGSGGVVEVDGQLVTKGWGIMANGDSGIVGNLTVSGAAYADGLHVDKVLRLDKEDVGAMLVHAFHGIRQSLPTDYTAATLPLTPKTRTDGVADIIYVREKKRFYAFWEAQKVYAERFDGDEEYNIITNNKPTTARTDRTWRWGAKLYAWDAEFALKDPSNLLSAYVGDLTCLNDSAKEAFIKSWNEAFYKGGRKFGEYNRKTGYFEGNGLTDINYEQAKVIMKFVGLCQNPSTIIPKIDGPYTFGGLSLFWSDFYGEGKDSRAPRTFPPLIQGASGGRYRSDELFSGDNCLQAVSFAGVGGMTGNERVFEFCRNLRYVLNMPINDTQGTKNGMFNGCIALETVELKGLLQGTVSFEHSPKLSLDSIKYMLNNREKSGAALTDEKYKFTIKLHADVFAKLTDDIIALATEMNATLVSA